MSIRTQLPNKGTLIAPSYMHGPLRLAYLNNQQGTYGLSIVTLSTFLKKYQLEEEKDEIELLLQYRKAIQSFSCPIYQNIVSTLDFLKQCSSFIENMKLYHIQVEDLPQATPAQKEMKQILSTLYTIPSKQNIVLSALQALSTTTLHDVYLMDAYYTHQENVILSILQDAQAIRIYFDDVRGHTRFFHAMNKRKEVEAMAQHIISEKQKSEDINIVACDASYKPLISQVFHRYKIPHTIVKESSTSILSKRVVLLLKYYQKPSTELIIELIQCNTFRSPYLQDFVDYLQIFEMQIEDSFTHVKEHGVESQLVSSFEIERLRLMEEHAQQAKDEIYPSLETLQHMNSMHEVFQYIDNLASLTLKQNDSKQGSTLRQIHNVFTQLVKDMKTKEDLTFAIDMLSNIQESMQNKQLQGAFITDSNAPLPPRTTTYMLGCTQKNYPTTPVLHGLFDEAYVKDLQGYPTMRERYDHHMKQYMHYLNTSKNLIVSYPLGGYDGKGNESALEMEQFLSMKAKPYPLYEHYQRISTPYHIHRESAASLFAKEQVIHGSISSFERYVRCPFAYFLAYGLYLREPIDYHFTPERIGTLSHYILERLVRIYQKEYANVSMLEVERLLQKELSAMAKVYPSFQPQLAIRKQRMLHSLSKNLEYLADMEAHAHLTNSESEREFWWDLPLQNDIKIRLHGFIDRIDSSSGYARIIDYKSSSKSLQEKDVFAGLKLQLLTYALFIEEDSHKQLLGAYYYSLKQENIAIVAGTMKRRPVEYHACTYEDYEILQHASHKLQGWTMEHDVDIIDDDATHIYGVRQNKDGIIEARKTYDLTVIKQHLSTIYTQIGERMLKGDIACTPTEDACMFCPYHDICRFNGYPRAVQPLVEIDSSIYKGGE